MGAPTLRESFNGGKLLGLSVYRSSSGGGLILLLSSSLLCFIVFIDKKVLRELWSRIRIALLILATVSLQMVRIARLRKVLRVVYACVSSYGGYICL